ncbi:hypothetical protein B484DRAFT_439125, partial [Ochromonadaceae sp. CCMP2298]
MIARAPSLLVALLALFALFAAVDADTPIDLGEASSYVILGRGIIFEGPGSIINGNMGVSPGTAFVDPTGSTIHNGDLDIDNPASFAAQSALTAAIIAAEGKESTGYSLSPEGIFAYSTGTPGIYLTRDAVTLVPGVYNICRDYYHEGSGCFFGGVSISAVLTLDAQGDPDAVWTFKIIDAGLSFYGQMAFKDGVGNANHVTWV